MSNFDPKWGNGCLVTLVGVVVITLIRGVMFQHQWQMPHPFGDFVIMAILLGFVRLILNQIFD